MPGRRSRSATIPQDAARRRRGVLALAASGLAAAALAGAALRPRTLVRWLTPTRHLIRDDDIAYGAAPRQRLDVYRPRGGGPPRPTVVFLYGGSWQSGARELYAFVGEAFASRGHVTVIPDYRLWPDVGIPGMVGDAAAAVAWARRHAGALGGDASRIIVAGHSAGAHLAAMVALDARALAATDAPGAVAAMIGLAGPYDFLPVTDPTLQRLFGADPATQPIHYVRADAPPLWLAHGTADTTVAPGNSERLAARAQAAGGRATLRLYPGVGHVGLVLRLAALLRPTNGLLDDIEAFIATLPEAASRVPAHPAL
ncbi:MAG: alpha/beta hydrolase [Proteobacteria bacterium]|nr:alpha/beta hydrolase [Pseudomonadota bacterium]